MSLDASFIFFPSRHPDGDWDPPGLRHEDAWFAAADGTRLPGRLLMTTRFDSAAKIGRYRGPLLQRHGTADRTVPYRLGRRLFDAANEPKQLVTIEGGDHYSSATAEWIAALDAFVAVLPPT